jgi:thymidylate synthase
MLATEPLPLPTVRLTEAGQAVTDIHEFRAEHFELSDYKPNPGIGAIPVSP